MYLELGKTKINYQSQGKREDSIILAEVVDSEMSFEKPVFVRTVSELTLWFGTDFKDFDYLRELVSSGNTLYLFRPILDEERTSGRNYIDYSTFLDNKDEFFINNLPEKGVPGKIYKNVNIEGKGKYKDIPRGYTFDKLIWLDSLGGWVNIEDLPQNLELPKTLSHSNRDTLRLCHLESHTTYCHPLFNEDTDGNVEVLQELQDEYDAGNIDEDAIIKGTHTLAFRINYENLKLKSESSYIILPQYYDKVLFYYDNGGGNIPEEPDGNYYHSAKGFSSIEDLIDKLSDSGYELVGDILYCPVSVHVTGLYNMEGLIIEPAVDINRKILDKLSKDESRIEFWSRTIGNGGVSGNITVKIEHTEEEYYYKVTIERYNIVETFFGYSWTTELDKRIDSIINRDSKIVYCGLIETYQGIWKNTRNNRKVTIETEYKPYSVEDKDNYYIQQDWRDPGLVEGKWELSGSTKETGRSHKKGLESLLKYQDTTYIDFILLPDPDNYVVDGNYESMWKWLLGKVVESGSQVLIECNEGNYRNNYTDDKLNYLLYFYESMMNSSGKYRPAYYTFLRGLLSGTYSFTGNDIIYTSPIERSVTYSKDDLKSSLVEKKANYMIDNGQYYYYPTYFDGPNYKTSGLMRFCLGKIQRELEKNKWSYLSLPNTGATKRVIEGILGKIQTRFSIVRSLLVKEFKIDQKKGTLSLKIETKISDLVKNIVDLDIIINYNKPI